MQSRIWIYLLSKWLPYKINCKRSLVLSLWLLVKTKTMISQILMIPKASHLKKQKMLCRQHCLGLMTQRMMLSRNNQINLCKRRKQWQINYLENRQHAKVPRLTIKMVNHNRLGKMAIKLQEVQLLYLKESIKLSNSYKMLLLGPILIKWLRFKNYWQVENLSKQHRIRIQVKHEKKSLIKSKRINNHNSHRGQNT